MSIKSFIFLQLMGINKRQQMKLAASGKHMDVDVARQRLRSMHGFFGLFEKPRADIPITEEELDGIYCFHAKPQGPTNKVILYLHGGGYVTGLQDAAPYYRYFICELAHLAKAEVFAPEYRLSPEHPHPAAVEDAYKCYLALLSRGFKPKDIFVSGDSAGGGLTLALLMKIRDESKPLPKAALPISPWADLALTGESMKSRADMDILLTEGGLADMASYFLNGQSPTDP